MEDLQGLLARYGFRFKKQFGQNFISDGNLLRAIVDLSGIDEQTTVVEIGCGAGTLTRVLAKKAKRVVAYEIDRALRPVLAESLRGCENVEVRFADFAKTDLSALEKELGAYVVVANLPYYITTPLIARFLDEGEKVARLVVMVQEEVADRLCAEADTPAYGAITAALALRASAKVVKRVPRTMFHPRPQVDSAVVRIDFEDGRLPVRDAATYRLTVRAAFLNRRKTLENNLMRTFGFSRETAQDVLQSAGVPDKARGETLSPERLAALSDIIFARLH